MKHTAIQWSLVIAATGVAGAQTTQSTSTQSTTGPAAAVLNVLPAPIGSAPVRVGIMGGGFTGAFPSSNVVTGQPYSAKQETQTVQTLADGTHITNGLQKVTLYRDSQGRTRTERTAPQPPGILSTSTPPVFTDIFDPVAGYHYTFESTNHMAYRSPFGARAGNAPPNPAWFSSSTGSGPVPAGIVPAQRSAAVPPTILPQLIAAPPSTNTSAVKPAGPEIVREQLGTQSIEGVLAEGVRTTTTFPVGAFGNDRPITTASEIWTSHELGMPVLTKMSDPRTGETTMKLTNISRAEPDASLFQPPSDYEIVDPQSTQPRK